MTDCEHLNTELAWNNITYCLDCGRSLKWTCPDCGKEFEARVKCTATHQTWHRKQKALKA
jgi:hypothetical protein